jgi:hypothetical protein
MASTISAIRVSGLGKSKLAALRAQAKKLGLSAEGYAKQLIEDGLSLQQQARTRTFDELFAPVQTRFQNSGMSEEDLDSLVDAARARHHERSSSKKR